MKNSKWIAEKLLEIDAIKVDAAAPFTWSSGIQSPIYCDNRLSMSYPSIREALANEFVTYIQTNYPDTEVICACATAGIPHAAWIAQKMNLPMIYVRGKSKGHGMKNKIEGVLKPDQKVVVIEDLISTGGSVIDVANEVVDAGGELQQIVSIFSYELNKAEANFQENNFTYHSLLTFKDLLTVVNDKGVLSSEEIDQLKEWKERV
ncbi:orotate phosphoribosyltransferase [Halalkalibacillus sediminis]|uniref:Orotate phosphoribosyltransferase n=1 Tax=Halalkalibacillus sediminis TaxID=2018042 RepID=A0A2I0QW45_9BACI|nr:orotate phosphoribosyltransferase [Halalkalibacillus sediminis]